MKKLKVNTALKIKSPKHIKRAAGSPSKSHPSQLIGKVLLRVMRKIEDQCNSRGPLSGLSSGIVEYDRLTNGLHGGEVVLVAGARGAGKTAFILAIVGHVAMKQNVTVGVFNPKCPAEALVERLLCSRARLNGQRLSRGLLSRRDDARLIKAAHELGRSPIVVDDTANVSISHLCLEARRMKDEHGARLLVVDGLDGLTDEEAWLKGGQRAEANSITKKIKALAQELKLPILVTSRIQFDGKGSESITPSLSDFQDGGSIDRHADAVVFLSPRHGKKDNTETSRVEMTIAKNQKGVTGKVIMVLDRRRLRFSTPM